ncbi:MAG: ABC transporter substrate-binding protein [Burkholderiaceae bacterium]|nr:ABC transporter substrate-binding protein [Burkholderiaceae bacterium]
MMLAPMARAADAGVFADRIVFGQTVGFDSVWGSLYKNYTDGMLACFEQVNAQGGVAGRKLVVKRLEDNYVPEKTVANVRTLIQEGVFGLVCMGGTGNTVAALPLLEQYRVPAVGAMTGAVAARKASAPLFHTRASYTDEVTKMVQHATTIGLKRIAVVYQDNAFGAGNADAAKAAANKFGAQIVALIPHNVNGGDSDMVVDRIASANPQTTLLFTSPSSVADMLLRFQAKYSPLPLPQPWVLSVTTPKTVFEKAGTLAHGVAVTQVMPGPNARTQPLVRAFREANDKFGVRTNQTYEAVEGFLTGRVIVEGLRACGANPTREAFIQALEGFGTRDFGGVRVHYDRANHAGLNYVDVAMIGANGNLVG